MVQPGSATVTVTGCSAQGPAVRAEQPELCGQLPPGLDAGVDLHRQIDNGLAVAGREFAGCSHLLSEKRYSHRTVGDGPLDHDPEDLTRFRFGSDEKLRRVRGLDLDGHGPSLKPHPNEPLKR